MPTCKKLSGPTPLWRGGISSISIFGAFHLKNQTLYLYYAYIILLGNTLNFHMNQFWWMILQCMLVLFLCSIYNTQQQQSIASMLSNASKKKNTSSKESPASAESFSMKRCISWFHEYSGKIIVCSLVISLTVCNGEGIGFTFNSVIFYSSN